MSGKTIGLSFNHGFAGSYARQPNMTINTKPNTGNAEIPYGAAVIQSGVGVKLADATTTASNFVGIASRQVQTATDFNAQNGAGKYLKNEAVPVFQQGRVNVYVADGTPAMYGSVYIRTVASGTKAVGDFECAEDTGKTVELTNCQWGGTKDANGVAELVIFTGIGA